MADIKRVQVPMPKALRDKMRDLATEVSKTRDEEIGIGNIAAELLELLVAQPAMLNKLLSLDSAAATVKAKRVKPERGDDIAA